MITKFEAEHEIFIVNTSQSMQDRYTASFSQRHSS